MAPVGRDQLSGSDGRFEASAHATNRKGGVVLGEISTAEVSNCETEKQGGCDHKVSSCLNVDS
jgi:hypothetical protein